jgi:hypothetical protein
MPLPYYPTIWLLYACQSIFQLSLFTILLVSIYYRNKTKKIIIYYLSSSEEETKLSLQFTIFIKIDQFIVAIVMENIFGKN